MKTSRKGSGLIAILMVAFFCVLAPSVIEAQCTEHPFGKTTVKFNNETRYDLTFYIDRDQTGIFVPSRQISEEQVVTPGNHLLSSVARLGDKEIWVWVINDIPAGQTCIWTVADPTGTGPPSGRGYRTLLDPGAPTDGRPVGGR